VSGRSTVLDRPLTDGAARLFLATGRLARALRRSSSVGLGHGTLSALATVVHGGPLRIGDLAAREGVSAPTMTRIVTVLVGEGYAVRQPDPDDGRVWLVRATEQGEQVITEVRSVRSQALLERMARLPADQRAALLAALPALEALAEDPP
jgi:DNA-binding MarR family transcriptional regulator